MAQELQVPTAMPARRRPVGRVRSRQLGLEAIEDRCLPSFGVPVNYAGDLSAEAVVSADFNGDGRLDLAALDSANSTVSVLLGNGDATFQAARTSGTANGPKALVAGDLNGDGRADLVMLHSSDLGVLIANGDGTFAPPQTITLPAQVPPDAPDQGALEQELVSVAVGDFNGDGELDVIAGGQTAWMEFIYYNPADPPELAFHIYPYANVLPATAAEPTRPTSSALAGGYPCARGLQQRRALDVVLSGARWATATALQDFVQSSVYIDDARHQPHRDFNGDGSIDVLANGSGGRSSSWATGTARSRRGSIWTRPPISAGRSPATSAATASWTS